MVKKIIHVLLIFCALVALLLAGAALAFHLTFSEPRLKKMTINGIRGFADREATIGRMHLGLLSGLGVYDLTVSDYPDFKAGTFASVKSMVVRLRLFPLLTERRLVVSELRLDAPKVNIVQEREGNYNFSGLAGSSRPGQTPRYAPVALLITDLSVANGELNYRSGKYGIGALSLRNADISARGISAVLPFDARFSGDVGYRGAVFSLSGTARVHVAGNRLEFPQVLIRSGKAQLALSGRVDGFLAPDRRSLALTVQGDRDVLDRLLALIPALAALQFGEAPAVHMEITLDARGNFRLRNLP